MLLIKQTLFSVFILLGSWVALEYYYNFDELKIQQQSTDSKEAIQIS